MEDRTLTKKEYTEEEAFITKDCLGRGGFAETWRAQVIDPNLALKWGVTEVAIKLPHKGKQHILSEEIETGGILQRQLTELEQKNIVKYFGVYVFEGKLVMAMEYIQGGNLRNLMGWGAFRKKIGMKKAIILTQGILNGLDVIHKKHIIHRDIKPENILMDGETPKITDLGIGRYLRPGEFATTKETGTMLYMAPEVLDPRRFGETYTYNADIWSVGITFYELLCGKYPFGITEKTAFSTVSDLIRDESVELKFPSEDLAPLQLQAIIAKMLKRNPHERYKIANEALKDLREFTRGGDEAVDSEIGLIQPLMNDPTQASMAESKLKELLKRFPDSQRIYLHIGEFYNRQGKFAKAIKMLNEGIERDPDNSLLYWGLAIAYQKNRHFKEAVHNIKKAIDIGLEENLERYAKSLLKTLQKKT